MAPCICACQSSVEPEHSQNIGASGARYYAMWPFSKEQATTELLLSSTPRTSRNAGIFVTDKTIAFEMLRRRNISTEAGVLVSP